MWPWCDGSAGIATPIEAATSRLGSFVADSAITANTTCPGLSMLIPSSRSTNSQCGGKIELTRTRLKFARCASRSAISKLVSFSLCRPTPLVRNALVGTNNRDSINLAPSPRLRVRFAVEPHRPVGGHRGLRIAGAIGCSLQDLGQHFRGRQRHFLDLHLRAPALLAADDEHVARRVDAQPPFPTRD